jgi:S-formylglutathione hydrolase
VELKRLSRNLSFGGWTEFYSHPSAVCGVEMRFSVFVPPQAAHGKVPVVYWLSGLTCSEENFMAKAGAQRVAAELGLMIVAPDTSPRGLNLPGDGESWDFGVAAGFYVNATQAPWNKNYQMYDYITGELPDLVVKHFAADPKRESIFGHSMGGHGALVAALRQPGRYASVSAFAPISAPSQCPWGKKAFTGYLGADESTWAQYDTNELVKQAKSRQELFIDQGSDDKFLTEQLKPEILAQTCAQMSYPLKYRLQAGYDHSYYFIASFVEDHLRYHAAHLRAVN